MPETTISATTSTTSITTTPVSPDPTLDFCPECGRRLEEVALNGSQVIDGKTVNTTLTAKKCPACHYMWKPTIKLQE